MHFFISLFDKLFDMTVLVRRIDILLLMLSPLKQVLDDSFEGVLHMFIDGEILQELLVLVVGAKEVILSFLGESGDTVATN